MCHASWHLYTFCLKSISATQMCHVYLLYDDDDDCDRDGHVDDKGVGATDLRRI